MNRRSTTPVLTVLAALAVSPVATAVPSASEPTAGIRFSSPIAPSEFSTNIIKYFDQGGQIYDCTSSGTHCWSQSTCSYDGHDGTDFRVDQNFTTPIHASAPGWVSGRESGHPSSPDLDMGLGNFVKLDHGCGVETIYGHMANDSSNLMIPQEGTTVACGQTIGIGATSGYVFGSPAGYFEHVHLEIRSDETPVDPFFSPAPNDCNGDSDISLWVSQNGRAAGYSCQAQHPPECPTSPPPVDRAAFIRDSDPQDGALVQPNQAITKSWTIRNDGNQDWTSPEYRIVFSEAEAHYEGVPSDRMGGPVSAPIVGTVAPGQEYQFTAQLTAPSTPGPWRAAWTLENTQTGMLFDLGFWIDIRVAGEVPVACDVAGFGEPIAPNGCWQTEYNPNGGGCGWQRCADGEGVLVTDAATECTGSRAFIDVCQADEDDYAIWVEDVLVPDDLTVLPGTRFEKRWRVQNTGTNGWGDGVELAYSTGYAEPGYTATQAGGPDGIGLETVVAPGDDHEVSVVLTAPQAPGRYISAWQLERDGTGFGDYLWVLFEVADAVGGGACVDEASGHSVPDGTCVQSDRDACGAVACAWQRCDGGAWACSDTDCDDRYAFPSCLDGSGADSGWAGWCPGPYCEESTSEPGCADGTREAFADGTVFPQIAGCSGTWAGPQSLTAAPTGADCGNDLGECASPADLCAPGWRICGSTGLPSDLTDRLSADQCLAADNPGTFAAGFSHSPNAWSPTVDCGPQPGPYPCRPSSWGSEPVCCGADCDIAICGSTVWPEATAIGSGVQYEACDGFGGDSSTGVLCCAE